MNILIAYAGSNSTTKMCAQLLAEKLPGAHVLNLSHKKPDLNDFDTIIIGSGIRFNNVNKSVLNFIRDNLDLLMNKNTAIYLCCGFPEKINQYLLHNFPKKLLNKATSIHCFGGRLKVKPYRLHDMLIMKMVQKNFKLEKRGFTEIDYDNIQKMADEILALK